MVFRLFVTLVILAGTLGVSVAEAAPAHIIILRHGEKISDSDRHLSPRGYERAEALVDVFSSTEFLSEYGRPVIFFAASGGKKSSLRSVETLAPSAKAMAVDLDTSVDKDDGKKLMQQILVDGQFDDRTVIICWNHKGISDLIRPLDDDFSEEWNSKVFDRFWIFSRQHNGKWDFQSIPQRLLPGDSAF